MGLGKKTKVTWNNGGDAHAVKKRQRGRSQKISLTWLDRNGDKPAPFARVLPWYSGTSDVPENLLPALFIGAMFSATCSLQPDKRAAGAKFVPLLRTWQNDAPVRQGSLLIYAGPVRAEEREPKTGKIVNVIRHTFVAANGVRYVINDFSVISPV